MANPGTVASPNWRNISLMALRALHRDWQSGELRVLAIALLIAVASVAAVGFFTDRIQQAMERKCVVWARRYAQMNCCHERLSGVNHVETALRAASTSQ